MKEGERLITFLDTALEAEHSQCLREGYHDEFCVCGRLFPANCHFVMCDHKMCPMQSGPSVLDMLLGPDEPEGEEQAA